MFESVKKIIRFTEAESYYEWPKNNDGWKQSEVEDLLTRVPDSTEVDGCAYNLRTQREGTRERLGRLRQLRKVEEYLKKARSGHTNNHTQVRGKEGKATEDRTEELVEAIVDCMFEGSKAPAIKPL